MKMISTTAIVALMTATLGFAAVAPAFAQPAAPGQGQVQAGPDHNFRQHDQTSHRGGMRGGIDLFNFERGTEAVEIALVRLSHAVELTSEQQPLFDALKTSALAAAAEFTTATEGLRPTATADGETAAVPDLAQRLETRIAVDTARLAALNAVQPAFATFFDSLTDTQKTQLMPQRPDRGGKAGWGHRGSPAPEPTEAPATNG
jgi:hypothetical protein